MAARPPPDDASPSERDLRSVRMPDGGQVFKGPLAEMALDAVDARAMTMDHTIFVREGFNPTDPEDQALYAHERYHQDHSGGAHEHGGGHDAEELAARAVEAMVLHRRAQGDDFGKILQDVAAGRIEREQGAQGPMEAQGEHGRDDDPMAAYHALIGQGWTHDGIVRMLARNVLLELQAEDALRQRRMPGGPALFGRRSG
jgi:hypothetical protein